MGITLANFFDGNNGWQQSPQGLADLNDAAKKAAREGVFRLLPNMLGLVGNPTVILEKKDGQNDVLLFTLNDYQVRLHISPAGEVVKRAYRSTSGFFQGDIEESFTDFKDLGGVKAAYKVSATLNGQKFQDAEMVEAKANTNPDKAKLAEKPK